MESIYRYEEIWEYTYCVCHIKEHTYEEYTYAEYTYGEYTYREYIYVSRVYIRMKRYESICVSYERILCVCHTEEQTYSEYTYRECIYV